MTGKASARQKPYKLHPIYRSAAISAASTMSWCNSGGSQEITDIEHGDRRRIEEGAVERMGVHGQAAPQQVPRLIEDRDDVAPGPRKSSELDKDRQLDKEPGDRRCREGDCEPRSGFDERPGGVCTSSWACMERHSPPPTDQETPSTSS